MRGLRTTVVILTGAFFVVGCSQTTSPASPSSVSSATFTPSPEPPTSAAVLAISGFAATAVSTENNGDYKFSYPVRFVLAETEGKSGATIQNIETAIEDRFNTGPACWLDTLRVPPGGRLDTFDTDAGEQWLGYCAPAAASRTEATRVSLVVTFTDDEGRTSTVQATTTVTK